ncbi:winged helix-turn-helix domain-containing protein [Shewanella benthica]|uniref:winged helix-turn-helix domain-containing protein n=1 Tax=Shewanella benthica TaxID=43661 RepID=UPI001879F5CB|nr:winged helix-turn-helix domain-containing protein [Shewanella benthica]MBE7216673.1 PD40 domain-containing protein [Shewanella benthica]MCL1064800.1 winged helix-turn-helix domain-containing protein [Shewanella benthica]
MITQPRYRLADRVIDPSQCTIIKDGSLLKVELRAMQVLVCLIKHAGEPVSRDMLLEEVWSGGEVSDNAINRIIGLLRNQLGDNAKSPSFIKTLPKVGYVLIAEITLVKEVTKEEKFTEDVIAGSHIDERDISGSKSAKRKLFSFLYEHSSKFILFFIGLVSLASWLAFQYFGNNPFVAPLQHSTELKRLTFLDGQEFSPVLSPDGKHLAFSQRELGEKNWRIGMMEIDSRAIVYLEDPMDNQGYPAFSPDGMKLAYLSFDLTGRCKINIVDLAKGEFGQISTLTSCKNHMQATSIAWKPSGKSLFYIDEDHQYDHLTEKKVFSISLNGNNKQQITQPYSIGRGDYSLSLSPDGKYLAMVRNVRWYQTQVILLSLETGIWQDLFTVDILLHTVAWARDSNSLIYRSMTGHLAKYDLKTSSHTQLTNIMQSIVSPISNQNGEIVAVLGEFFKTEIWRLESEFEEKNKNKVGKDKNELDIKSNAAEKYIFSNGMNYTASTNLDGSKVAFVSNRTGVPELWLKSGDEGGTEVKLTSFEEITSIKDISFSTSGRYILGRMNDSPFVYDTYNQMIRYIVVKVDSNIYSVSWGPSSSSIVVTIDTLGLSSLELIDVNTGELIQSLSEGGEYGKYSSKGQFFFTKRSGIGLWTLIGGEEFLFLKDFTITSNLSWTIVDNYIYNLIAIGGGYKLVRSDIETGERLDMDIHLENLSGYSISVDKSGAVFMLVSDPQNVDVIEVDYE